MDSFEFMVTHLDPGAIPHTCANCGSDEKVGGSEKLCWECREVMYKRAAGVKPSHDEAWEKKK